MMQKWLMVGLLQVNCYILGDEETKEAVVIDTGGDEHEILEAINYHGFTLKYIIDTHGHFDHVDANQPLKDATGAEIVIHELDAAMLQRANEALFFTGKPMRPSQADIIVQEGDVITFGPHNLKVLHTPGHTPGGISLVLENQPLVYVGDTLFAGECSSSKCTCGRLPSAMRRSRTSHKLSSRPSKAACPGNAGWQRSSCRARSTTRGAITPARSKRS